MTPNGADFIWSEKQTNSANIHVIWAGNKQMPLQQGAFPHTSASSSSSFALLFVLLGASTSATLRHHLLLHHVDDFVWDSQILDGASSDVALRHPPELISILSEGSAGVNVYPPRVTFFWHSTGYVLCTFSLQSCHSLGYFCTMLVIFLNCLFNYLQAQT